MGSETLAGGIVVATLTPYDRRGRVDLAVARDHAAYLAENGVSALAPVGTTGEFLFLDEREKRDLVAAAVQASRGRCQVMAGVWARDPDEVARLAAAAEDAGAAAVFLTTPIYYSYSDAALYSWYRNVVDEVAIPVLCYNIPACAGNEISAPLFQRLADEGGVAGIKDSTASEERIRSLLASAGEGARVYAASDGFAAQARELGAHGFVSALANISPQAFVQLWNGDPSCQEAITSLRSAVKQAGGIPALKHLLTQKGFPAGGARLPFSPISPSDEAMLERALAELEGRLASA